MNRFLIRPLLSLLSGMKFRRFESLCQNIEKSQSERWEAIRNLIEDSPFWKSHYDGEAIPRSLSQFPLSDYETYRSCLEKDYAQSVRSTLTKEPILFWCESSGSTGKRKVFPLTPSFQNEFQQTTMPLLASILNRFPGFLKNPILYFAATQSSQRAPSQIQVGYISHFNYRNIPRFLKSSYAFPYEVFKDSSLFFEWGPVYAIASPLSGVFAISPSMLIQFMETIQTNRIKILDALRNPSLTPEGMPKPKISANRLQQVEKAFTKNIIQMNELWPEMEMICCWIGSTCGLQIPLLKQFTGTIPVIDATYSATEGWMTVPFESGKVGGPFHPGGHVLEFLPADLDHPTARDLISPSMVQAGKEYEVVLTTSMGFVRYRLYDVVRCNGFFHQSPILEFRRKAGRIISLGQTRINEAHLIQAHSLSQEKLKCSLKGHWVVGPSQFGNQLVLYLEKDQDASVQDLVVEMDRCLGKLNEEYWADRETGLLKPIASRYLGEQHELWNRFPRHAQAKPTHLIQEVISSP